MLYNNQKIITPRYVIELARHQRQKMTYSEKVIWAKLKNKQIDNLRFRCQHPIYRYFLDFYCHEAMLGIEIDGDIHKTRIAYDNYRDEFLKSIGIKTLRFPVKDVIIENSEVMNIIRNELSIRSH
jgi:very-short-patch-repair endonuclease